MPLLLTALIVSSMSMVSMSYSALLIHSLPASPRVLVRVKNMTVSLKTFHN